MINKKIKIVLESYDYKQLLHSKEFFVNQLESNMSSLNIIDIKYISLPTTRRIYCILRSPHIDKDSREHFQIKIYKNIIYIETINCLEVLKKLTHLSLDDNSLCHYTFNTF